MWKKIEEAPKDGMPILGFADGKAAVVYWYSANGLLDFNQSYWSLTVTGAYASDSEWNPVLWHELPIAPKES